MKILKFLFHLALTMIAGIVSVVFVLVCNVRAFPRRVKEASLIVWAAKVAREDRNDRLAHPEKYAGR